MKIHRDHEVDAPTAPWLISRPGLNFAAERGSLELYRGETAPALESIGIRSGMKRRRSWHGGDGVP